ncbi:hypothetical protein JOC36_000912 [Weissella uvarum]|nr:hypothetical protein [Weissella uvarum]
MDNNDVEQNTVKVKIIKPNQNKIMKFSLFKILQEKKKVGSLDYLILWFQV